MTYLAIVWIIKNPSWRKCQKGLNIKYFILHIEFIFLSLRWHYPDQVNG